MWEILLTVTGEIAQNPPCVNLCVGGGPELIFVLVIKGLNDAKINWEFCTMWSILTKQKKNLAS